MALEILFLCASLLCVVSGHDDHGMCKIPHHMTAVDPKDSYKEGESVKMMCVGKPGHYQMLMCNAKGNWLMTKSCDDHHDMPDMSGKHSTGHEMKFDHYHPNGKPHKHTPGMAQHYHPHSKTPMKPMKPKPTMPKPTVTMAKTTQTTRAILRPCANFPRGPNQPLPVPVVNPGWYPAGYRVDGLDCEMFVGHSHAPPGYRDLFYIICDPDGSGNWLIDPAMCGGHFAPQQQFPQNPQVPSLPHQQGGSIPHQHMGQNPQFGYPPQQFPGGPFQQTG